MRVAPSPTRPDRVLLEAHALELARGGRMVLRVDALDLHPGERMALVGPNGAGKSTLLAALAGLVAPQAGTLRLAGAPLDTLGPEVRARAIAWLPQAPRAAWGITLAEVAALGRIPWGGADPAHAAQRALERCGIAQLARSRIDQVSGGEARRAHLARAFATEAQLLLLDEPVSDLDPLHRARLLELLALEAAGGVAVVVVLHDLDLALRWAHRVVLLGEGRVLADGPPSDVLTDAHAGRAFGMRVEPCSGLRLVLP